jgi:hypothetical protein
MVHLSLLRKGVLALAAVTALAAAVPVIAAETQPKVLVDAPMPQEAPPAVFVSDGARAYAAGIAGARLRILDNHSFTISGGSLPPIAGRWQEFRIPATFMLGLWAKTDQIDFTGEVFPMGGGGLGIQYWVQINAPRTDGGETAVGGSLPPTCLWTVDPLGPSGSEAKIQSRSGTNAPTAMADLAITVPAAGTQPQVMLDVLMTTKRPPIAVFVPDGAEAYAAGIAAAHLRILDDHTFTISGGSLPPIVGRWMGFRTDDQGGFNLALWAKTDQINFTGQLFTQGSDSLGIDYFVQINAPRTDGGEAAAGGSLQPTCLWSVHTVEWPDQAAG